MAAFLVMFIFTIAVIVSLLWVFFKSLPWILRRAAGITLSFQFDGWNCLKDVTLHFKKGSIESIVVGEFKANLSQSLVELCATAFIQDPKVIFSICDLKVKTRPSNSSKSPRKPKTRKSSSGGKGKLMLFANIGRFFTLSMTNMVVQTPKATAEIKELELDLSKDRGSGNFFIKLYLLPIFVQIGEPHVTSIHSPEMNSDICLARQTSSKTSEGSSFHCEKLSFSCEFGHNRESSPSIKNVEVDLADAVLNLNEKLLLKKKSSTSAASTGELIESSSGNTTSEKPPKQPVNVLVAKHAPKFPEKVLFDLSKLEIRFVHQEHDFSIANSITGFQLRSAKSQSGGDGKEDTCLDFVMELQEMHLFRESEVSVLEMTKFAVFSKVYCPIQESFPVRAEVEIKLGGIMSNIIMTRFEPLLRLHFSRKKKMVLKEERPNIAKSETTGFKAVVWKCATSAPDVTVVIYSPGGSPIYQCGLDSFQVTANNMSNRGTVVQMELNELNLCMVDEHKGCLKESLFGLESDPGSLISIRKVKSEWGKKEGVLPEGDGSKGKQTLVVDVSEIGLLFSFRSVEALTVNAMSIQAYMKSLTGASNKNRQEKGAPRSKPSGRGTQLLKLNVERCSLNFAGDSSLENTVIDDPKRVNYGSQGGRIIISVSADGSPRTASVFSTLSKEHEKLKYIISFEILKFGFTLNKEIQSTQVELETAKAIYQEFLEEPHQVSRVTLCDIQNAKFVRRIGGGKEVSICSLFSASNIAVRWEPDVHISMVELGLRLKSLVLTQKLKQHGNKNPEEASTVTGDRQKEEPTTTPNSVDKKKKKESIFAVDVEMLSITAEAGDGVEAEVQIQSIFSENVGIGVLLEGFMLGFCGCRIVKSSRVQISRIPSMPSTSSSATPATGTPWDWIVQGVDIHICMPFRLQLRAIDDAVEEMLRALKLVINAKTKLIFPKKKESSTPKKPGSKKVGRIRFGIRKLIFDIEEEPLQGWLDEHYHLMRKEAYELAIRSKFLDELISSGNQVPKTGGDESDSEKKLSFEGEEIDPQDPAIIQMMNEKLYKQSFSSYYKSCQSLRLSDGSGACKDGFQAGFKMSTSRTSLLSVSVTDLDLSLTAISGGEAGMIEIVKKLDPLCEEKDIPFSRVYGSNLRLNTGTLAVQIRDYTFPLLSTALGKCEGCLVLAQQATAFQPQIIHDVYIGRWRKVTMLRSASGTTPAMKTYLDLPIHFQKGQISFGIGYEPVLADISYAFTVALRRANLSLKGPGLLQPPKKEKSLPWWDEMRNYIHGNVTLSFSETKWIVLATPDPYEKLDKLQMTSASVEIQQSDGRVHFSAEDIKIFFSSFEGLARHYPNSPICPSIYPFLEVPRFSLEVRMDWECESGSPLNHYLFALPNEGKARDKIYDPFRSTSLSLRWDFTLRPENPSVSAVDQTKKVGSECKPEKSSFSPPTINIGAHDLAWLIRFWNMNYLPPYKLRTFSRWPRFGVPRIPRSGNLSLDRVMTEYNLRLDVTPICIKHMTLDSNNPAKGLTFDMTKLKYEICFSRGNQDFTFECKRETLDPVYQGIDFHLPKAFLRRDQHCSKPAQMSRTSSLSGSTDRVTSDNGTSTSDGTEKHPDDGFLFSSDYFTIRRQAPKADPERLMVWKEEGKIYREKVDARSTKERQSEPEENSHSDPSDDDGYNVVIADNCQRIFVYGLKLLWNIENRDAVLSFAGGMSKAFQPPKPSPSRQYAQRKLLESSQKHSESEVSQDDPVKQPSTGNGNLASQSKEPAEVLSPSSEPTKTENFASFPLGATKTGDSNGSEEEGTRHFMVNVVEPQFNLHSEDINGRFLLAAASGRVLARSFHSVVHVAYDMIEKAAQNENDLNPENGTDMTWTRMEVSMMLEHVQAHVAPTDVDPGAGVQWLPKIRRSSPKAKRTGALLERVFMPCDMYFQYTRHKGVTPDLKVKPLKELTFNSRNITASMTSRQFQVMTDVLSNLLFARLPKAHNDSLKISGEEDDEVEEEIDEVVPDGIEEVELAKIELEEKERDRMLLLDDIRKLTQSESNSGNINLEKESDFWMITGGRPVLVERLRKVYLSVQQSRKTAYTALRTSVKNAAELRLLEKDKNKRPSSAMRISLQINKVIWSMVLDGKTFAEVEIDNMIYDFNRDYRDIGIAQFTTRYVVLRNCLPNAKCDTVLSAWNPPPEWGKKVMLQVDARQGAPKDGQAPYELFQVEIYPLKIHLTETMYTMMWEYIFPGEEQHSQRREEVWKVSTTSGSRRRKGSFAQEAAALLSQSDLGQGSKNQNLKSSTIRGSGRELRRTSSFDRSWEETVAESVATELVLSSMEHQSESSKGKLKDSKTTKAGRSVHEEKKGEKSLEDKKSRPQKIMQFQTIKISQVELLITYEGSRFVVNDMKLCMDTFHRVEFSGTWRRLFSRVKKHIIWGVLKSVTGMQMKKFKDKAHVPKDEIGLRDKDESGRSDQDSGAWVKRPGDNAGDGFVTSIRGIFNTQRRKAKKFVLRTMRGETEDSFPGEWSDNESDFSPFARQLTITKAKKLIRRHSKKFQNQNTTKGSKKPQLSPTLSPPKEEDQYESDSSSGSSAYEEFLDQNQI
ncbi:FMP27 GFWDK domain [Arabidopsis thaliana x Arabidopsis arenosa]|uniref:FMP27 GFWDK domain n=1 Tax=Arabidopsis thaliana x Arabidopsis arenosa TaxID=1240361 RepID=A0A8T1XQV8_9BRAS|nr:FMP27 GFWDK domain [Arabidopsis thaliana x Arabidopsis arenosa]